MKFPEIQIGQRVRALTKISDGVRFELSARRGEEGEVKQLDDFHKLVYVDFGKGECMAFAEELELIV